MTTPSPDHLAIESRYRSYCNACQSSQLSLLTNFWSLPALFTVDFGEPNSTQCKIITTSSELEGLYSKEFGPPTGVDKTLIDTSEVKFFGDKLATMETNLRHEVKGVLHDRQHALYICSKVEGVWWFVGHVSMVDVVV